MTTYTVQTRDVDGRAPSRKYKTLAAARKRFEEMVGYSMENAIAEQYHQLEEAGKTLPKAEEVRSLRAVSNYGCVVMFFATNEEN